MYVYNYRLFDRYDREVVSLVVLADDDPGWRPGGYSYGRWGFYTGIWFPAVKLLDYALDEAGLEGAANPFATVVLAHLKTLETRQDPADRQAWKVRLVKGLYDRGLSEQDVRQLFRFIDWIMDLPEGLAQLFWDEIARYEEDKSMPFMTTPERLSLEKGRLEYALRGIELGLKLKFGAAGLQLMPEIRSLGDLAKLDAVFQAIETAASPEEVRRVWAQ
jgi:hypothetical protein